MREIAFSYPRPQGVMPGIGIVGAGEIVQACHLPAYRNAGFPVLAVTDQNAERARAVADDFGIETCSASLSQMLEDTRIGVIDIAVPPQAQHDIVAQAVAAGKHVLCQKPLGLSTVQAAATAKLVADADVKGAVNQQMRYAPSIAQLSRLIGQGQFGALKSAAIDVHVKTPWENWPFWHGVPDFELFGHTIHYLDTLRSLLGDPVQVFARTAMAPARGLPGPIRNQIMLRYPEGLFARIDVDHDAPEAQETWRAAVELVGEKAVARGENGALFDYPVGRADSLALFAQDGREDFALEGRWFPDAFMATMGELLLAIEEDRAPANSVADCVQTIALVEAVALSAREKRAVNLTEITDKIQ